MLDAEQGTIGEVTSSVLHAAHQCPGRGSSHNVCDDGVHQPLAGIRLNCIVSCWANYYWAIITRFKWFNRRILDEFQEAQDNQFFGHFGPFFSIGRSGRVIERCASSRRILKKKYRPCSYQSVLVQAFQSSNIGVILIISPSSSSLGGQKASGPPSYIQVGPPGSDFRGPGAEKKEFKAQKLKN